MQTFSEMWQWSDETTECASVPLQALPEGLVGVDPGGHTPLQDVIIVPLPPKGLL